MFVKLLVGGEGESVYGWSGTAMFGVDHYRPWVVRESEVVRKEPVQVRMSRAPRNVS